MDDHSVSRVDRKCLRNNYYVSIYEMLNYNYFKAVVIANDTDLTEVGLYCTNLSYFNYRNIKRNSGNMKRVIIQATISLALMLSSFSTHHIAFAT